MFSRTVNLPVFSLFSIGDNFDGFYNRPYEVTNKAADLRTNIQTAIRFIGYSMMEKDESITAEYIQGARDNIQFLREGAAFMRGNVNGEVLQNSEESKQITEGPGQMAPSKH